MGSSYCGTVVRTPEDGLQRRFEQLVEDCQYTYGHGGYTGTFAEKHSVQVIRPPADDSVWTQDSARIHCQDNNEKWDDAYAYWLGGDQWYIGGYCSD